MKLTKFISCLTRRPKAKRPKAKQYKKLRLKEGDMSSVSKILFDSAKVVYQTTG